MQKKPIEQELNAFFELLEEKESLDMIETMFEVYELYDVDQDEGWLAECIKKEDIHNVRFIRTAYLLSKFASRHAGRLCLINVKFPHLWKRLEEITKEK